MKTLKYLQKSFFLLVMGISLSFICACSGNDEEPVREPEKEESLGIIGTWRHEFSTGFSYIYFDKAGYGWENEYDEADGGWYGRELFTYVYDATNKVIVIKYEDEAVKATIAALSETKLVLEDFGDTGLTIYERISDGEYNIGDDETQKPEQEETPNLVGTWRCDYDNGSGYDIFCFEKSGEGWFSEGDHVNRYKYDFSYAYNASSRKLFLHFHEEEDTDVRIVLKLTDTVMVLRYEDIDDCWDEVYYRQQ